MNKYVLINKPGSMKSALIPDEVWAGDEENKQRIGY